MQEESMKVKLPFKSAKIRFFWETVNQKIKLDFINKTVYICVEYQNH